MVQIVLYIIYLRSQASVILLSFLSGNCLSGFVYGFGEVCVLFITPSAVRSSLDRCDSKKQIAQLFESGMKFDVHEFSIVFDELRPNDSQNHLRDKVCTTKHSQKVIC